jgi:curli biogenesis system outer membrane secretion channel CsgG
MGKFSASLVITASLLASATFAGQPRQAAPSNAEKLQRQAMGEVPHCTRSLGTLSIADGDDPSGWTQFSLAPPSKLLKVIVARSGCFRLVDRGTGLNAAERERDIGNGLGHQRGSNVGMNQIKAADYVLVAEVQAANHNAQGSGVGAGIGGIIGGPFGGLIGGIHSRKMEANTVLSVTNVRTTETIATTEGYAAKNDIGFGAGGGVFGGLVGGAAVGGGYDNTDIGRIVTLSFIDAYNKLVDNLGGVQAGSAGTAEAAPTRSFVAVAPGAMRRAPSAQSAVVRMVPAGSTVYPTGKKEGLWWEVSDENDNVGWMLNTKLAPGK